MRKCKSCSYVGAVDTFPLAGIIEGRTYRRHLCGGCYTKQKATRRRKIAAHIADMKKSSVCEVCGFADHRALQFHHRDPKTKNFSVGNTSMVGQSVANIVKEVDKCMILCANCHQILHHKERSQQK